MYPVCTGSAALQRRVIRLRSDGFFVAGRVVFLFVNRYPKEYVALDHKKAGKRRASHRPEWSYCLQLLRWRSRCFGLVALLSRSRRHTRLSLHRGFVNHGTLFQLSTAQVAFGDKVEVSGLTLSSALPRRDAAGVGLVGPIRGQVVLDVD